MNTEQGPQGPIVIVTGGSRGIGAGLVRAFAEAGCTVHYTARGAESLARAQAALPPALSARVFGHLALANDAAALQAVWDAAATKGPVAAFIANAGVSHPADDACQHRPEAIHDTLETNLGGLFAAAAVALPGFQAQGHGFFYLMEGLGSRGEWQPSLTLYGASKYAASYVLRGLFRSRRHPAVSFGALSPGMVVTDLLLADSGGLAGRSGMDPRRKRLYNILADRVETVAPWLAGRVLADLARGTRPRRFARFAWLSTGKAFVRFLSAGIRPRNIVD